MSSKSSKSPAGKLGNIARSAGLLAWVLAGFVAASLAVSFAVLGLGEAGVLSEDFRQTTLQFAMSAFVYGLSLALVVGLPYLVFRWRTSWSELGMHKLPSWRDILISPAATVVYFGLSMLIMALVVELIPGFNVEQAQDVGFSNLAERTDLVIAFLTLVVLAPVAEEVLFRGYLYGKLRRYSSVAVAAVLTSALFGLVHGQWNVALDTFVLSLVMCGLREFTGTIWAGVLVHMLKNGLAFYLLFINPNLMNMVG